MTEKKTDGRLLSKKGLEFLNLNSFSSIEYYYNPDNETYYIHRVGNGGYGLGDTYYNPIPKDSALGKELAGLYPRGVDTGFEDYNPLLETVSTIKASESDLPITAVAGASGSVRFPHDMLIDEGEDFVMFDFYDYKPPFQDRKIPSGSVLNQELSQYNASSYASQYFKDKAYPQIILYMPQDVTDSFSAKWQGKKFGALTTGILAAAGDDQAIGKLNNLKRAAEGVLNRGTAEAAAKIVTGLASKITGDTISANDLFTGISGVARNPNVEVLFQSMELRTFDLTFKMAPYDNQDVQNMDAVIRLFKMAMLPQYKLSEGTKVFGMDNDFLEAGFIQVPKLCAVNFMRGSNRNHFLPKYKMCAITDVNVNYTPDNVYATFDRSSPVATELKLSFMETKLVFSEDIAERGF